MGLRSLLEITCCGGSSNRAPAGAAKTKHYVMINLKRQGLVVLYVLSSGWHHRRSRQREALSSGYPRMPGSRGAVLLHRRNNRYAPIGAGKGGGHTARFGLVRGRSPRRRDCSLALPMPARHEAAQRGAGDQTDGEGFHGTLPIGSARPVTSPPTLNWHEWYRGRRPPDVRYPTQKPSRNISRWPHVLGRALWATTQ